MVVNRVGKFTLQRLLLAACFLVPYAEQDNTHRRVVVPPVSTSQLLCISAITVFLFVAVNYAGWAPALISGYILTLGGITTTLYASAGAARHFGVAPSAPTIYLGDVLLVGALLAIWAQRGRLKIGWLLAIFVLTSCALLLTDWGNTPEQWSGLKLYVTAIASFGIGRWLSANLTDQAALVVSCACLIACGLQFMVTFAQSRGIILFARGDAGQWIGEGRMVGLYNHPGMVGKTMLLLCCFLLPLSTSSHVVTRRLAYLAIALGAVTTLLTLSRANSLAIGMAVVLWAIFSGKVTSIAKRLSILAAAGVLIAVNTTAIAGLLSREAADPEGGYRSHILGVGLAQIRSAPWTGTGPNYYSEIVGQYDRLAASGFPLHNSFLFPIAELGAPLALILLLPLLITLRNAFKRVVEDKTLDVSSAALLSVLPGIFAIAWTGWALMGEDALPLWYMGFGFLASRADGRQFSGGGANHHERRTTSRFPTHA